MILAVAFRSAGLREPIVDVAAAAAADPVQHAVDDAPAVFVFVEAVGLKVVDVSRRLRNGKAIGVLEAASKRIGIVEIVFRSVTQKRHEIARRGKSESCNEGIFCRVRELVDMACLEGGSGRQQPDSFLVDVFPITCGQGHRRIVQTRAHGQSRLGFVHRRRCIRERVSRSSRIIEIDVLVRRPRDARTIAVLRHRNGDRQLGSFRRRFHVPAVCDDGVALVHEEAGTCIRGLDGIVGITAAVQPVPAHHAPVVDVDEQSPIALAQIDRLEDNDIHRVQHLAIGAARRELNVGDERVSWIRRIDFTVRFAAKLLVSANVPERSAFQGGRFLADDLDLGDARLGGLHGQAQLDGERERGMHEIRWPTNGGCHNGPPPVTTIGPPSRRRTSPVVAVPRQPVLETQESSNSRLRMARIPEPSDERAIPVTSLGLVNLLCC